LDPTYPAAYALGIAHFRRGAYPASAQAFRDWVDAHPEGPYALRAKNFLRAALAADTSVP
jgi:TolA-binding protein